MNPFISKDQILTDIETLYQLALDKGRWHIALRAKELQGKVLGIFQQQRLPDITSISDMNEEQLRQFIARLEEMDPELKNLESSEIENSRKQSQNTKNQI